MDFYADIFNDVNRLLFSSSVTKNGMNAINGIILSFFKYVSVNGVNPGSNNATLKC